MSEHVETEEIKEPKKRGRKPNPNSKNYFGAEEEQAFQTYLLTSDPIIREDIFKQKLQPAFTKMVESIIRRYNLFTPYEDFQDTFNDAMSFMTTKVSNFKPGKGKKAYSYCGTICKNYLINKRLTAMKRENKFLSYDKIYSETHPDDRFYESELDGDTFNKGLIKKVTQDILDTIEEGVWDDGTNISDNEKKVGYAIIELLKNCDNLFQFGETQKFNKTNVLYFIKESTLLNTKEVKEAIKKYKLGYLSVKENYITNS